MKIDKATSAGLSRLWDDVHRLANQADCLEQEAQTLAEALHRQFEESIVLSRVFLTVAFGNLPASNQAFVRKLAASAGGGDELADTTPVLSLIASHGQEKDWCDRRKSQGHVGIPLLSAQFVSAIPMISRLLGELGVPMNFLDTHDTGILIETIGRKAGLFYVADAAKATDQQGRKIIAAQDFVAKYNVKSVFGVGGAYDGGQILVIAVFCRDSLPRTAAENFLSLVNLFQSDTDVLVSEGRVFADA